MLLKPSCVLTDVAHLELLPGFPMSDWVPVSLAAQSAMRYDGSGVGLGSRNLHVRLRKSQIVCVVAGRDGL